MKLYALACCLVITQALPFKDINDGARILSLNQLDSYSIPNRNTQQEKPLTNDQDDDWAIISRMREMNVPPSPDAKDYYSLHEQTTPNRFSRVKRQLKFDDNSKSVDPGLQTPPRKDSQREGNGLSFEGSSSPSSSSDGDKKFLPGLFGIQGPGYYGGGYPYPIATNQPYYGGGYQPIYGNGYYGGGYPVQGGYPTAGYPVGGGYPYPTVGGYPGGGVSSASAAASASGGRPPFNSLHGNGYYPGGYGNGYGNGYYPNGGITPILGGGIGPAGLGGPQFGIIGGGFFKDGKDKSVSASSSSSPSGTKGSVTFEK